MFGWFNISIIPQLKSFARGREQKSQNYFYDYLNQENQIHQSQHEYKNGEEHGGSDPPKNLFTGTHGAACRHQSNYNVRKEIPHDNATPY
jgi:hypothetical protein